MLLHRAQQHTIDDGHYDINQQTIQQQGIEHEEEEFKNIETEESDIDECDNHNNQHKHLQLLQQSQLQLTSQFNIYQQDVIQSNQPQQIEPEDQNCIVVVDNVEHQNSNNKPEKCKSFSGYTPQPRHQKPSSNQHSQRASIHKLQPHNTNQINNNDNTRMNSKVIVNPIPPVSIVPQKQLVQDHQQQQHQQQILQDQLHPQTVGVETGVLSSLHGSFSPQATIPSARHGNVLDVLPKPTIIIDDFDELTNNTHHKSIEQLEQESFPTEVMQFNTTSNIQGLSALKQQLTLINHQLLHRVNGDPFQPMQQHQSKLITASTQLEQQCLILQSKYDLQSQYAQLQLQQQQFELKQQQFEFQQEQFQLKQQQFDLQQQKFELQQQSHSQFHDGIYESFQEMKNLVCAILEQFDGKINYFKTDFDGKMNEFKTSLNDQTNIITTNFGRQMNEFTTRINNQICQIAEQMNEFTSNLGQIQENVETIDDQLDELKSDVKNDVETNINPVNDTMTEISRIDAHQPTKSDVDDKLNEFKKYMVAKIKKIILQIIRVMYRIDAQQLTKSDTYDKFNEFKKYMVATNKKIMLQIIRVKYIRYLGNAIVANRFKSAHQERIHSYQQHIIENQRKQIPLILAENEKEKKKFNPITCCMPGLFHFVFIPRCTQLHDTMLCDFVNAFLPVLSRHKASTLQNSKLYISTPSVLNGEWFQVQGDGKVIDIKTINLHQLLKPGDDIYPYSDYPCNSKDCLHCNSNDFNTTSKGYLIIFHWE